MVRADQQDGRRLAWVGRSGVELLDLGEHLQFERESLGRYSRGSDGAIDWSAVADDLVLCSMDSDSIELSNIIQEYAPGAGILVFFWGSLAIPSVKMESESAVSHLSSIMESMPEFWVYSPSSRVVLENSFSGVVTVAHVPADPDGPSSA
jgi:hypothetical protein